MVNKVNNVRFVYQSDLDYAKMHYPGLLKRVLENVEAGAVLVLEND